MKTVGSKNYPVEFNRIIAAAEKRFEEKRVTGWSGWNEPTMKGNMAARAYRKFRKLANGTSENPLKDAADVMNFCVFFFVQHPECGEKDEVE